MNRRINQKNTQIIFAKVAILLLSLSAIFYVYMCASLVFEGVYLRKLSAQINQKNVELAMVESALSKERSSLALENVSEYGFTEIHNSYFAVRKNEVTTFSMIYER